MRGNQQLTSFGQKLDWLKAMFRLTDGEIGAATGASDSLVCRWRKDERIIDRFKDEIVLERLADFFLSRAEQTGQILELARVLSLTESNITGEKTAFRCAFTDFLYDGKPIVIKEAPSSLQPPQGCFLGMDGLLNALEQLEKRIKSTTAGITVYLSLEYSRIVREESVKDLWEALCRISGGNPVRLVFDRWESAEEAAKTLRGLLPFIHTGQMRLYLIKSTQKFFYSNISFYAGGLGIIITSEPVVNFGDSISTLVESSEYIKGMGGVFAKFDKNSKPVERHLLNPKDEAVCFGQLFEPTGDLKTIIDGANLLYMSVDAYMKLLKLNGINGTQRAYRMERFVKDKWQFEKFLETNRVIEIFSLPAFDEMIASQEIKAPDFSFHGGTIKADAEILKSLYAGILGSLERYRNLSVYLNRQGLPYPNFSCRLKGDRFVLLHSFESERRHAVYSDTWLLIYEYIRQFDEALGDGDLITTKKAAQAAIKIRLESLGG